MDLYIQKICFDKEAWQEDKERNKPAGIISANSSLAYPFSIPAIRQFMEAESFSFKSPVTIFVGENGSGKSTLIEAIACCFGINPEGGSRNFHFSTYKSHSGLGDYMYYTRIRRPRDSYFLRAESFYNVITEIERLDSEPDFSPPVKTGYGGVNLHEKSHGESFFAVLKKRLRGNGLYVMDEPEAAVSVTRQLEMLQIIRQLVKKDSQFIMATHSPIIMAYPEADIIKIDEHGFSRIEYEETEQYQVMHEFMRDYKKLLNDYGL